MKMPGKDRTTVQAFSNDVFKKDSKCLKGDAIPDVLAEKSIN